MTSLPARNGVADRAAEPVPIVRSPGGSVPAGGDPLGASARTGTLAGRSFWALADQLFSSLANFLLGLSVARSATPREFGAFAVVLTIYQLVVFMSRAVASDPLVMRFSATAREPWRTASKAATGTSLVLGVGSAVLLLTASPLVPDMVGTLLLALALGMPGLLLQDCWRYSFFAAAEPRKAALNDLLWLVAMVAVGAGLIVFDRATVRSFVLAWAGGATLAALVGCWQARAAPSVGRAAGWLSSHRDITARLAAELLLENGSVQVALFAVAAISGLAAIGSIRAALILIGPLYVVYQSVQAWAVPEGVRLLGSRPARVARAVHVLAVTLASVALLWGVLLLFLPDTVGRAFLGDSWRGAHALLVPLTFLCVATGTIAGTDAGLRALVAVDRTLRASAIAAPLIVGLTTVGATVSDAPGAATGWALSNCILAAIMWVEFHRANAQAHQGQPAP